VETKNQILFTIALKVMKYLGVNLTKRDSYTENDRMKEIKEDLNI